MTKEQGRKLAINQMVDDIKELEKLGFLNGEELWDSINIYDYSNLLTEKDKIKAFQMAGYKVYQWKMIDKEKGENMKYTVIYKEANGQYAKERFSSYENAKDFAELKNGIVIGA